MMVPPTKSIFKAVAAYVAFTLAWRRAEAFQPGHVMPLVRPVGIRASSWKRRSSTRQLHGSKINYFDGAKKTLSNIIPLPVKEKVNNIAATLVPAIPLQEDPDIVAPSGGVAAQFRPRFIAKEFLYGARYMCQMLPLLQAGSLIGHISRSIWLYWSTGSGVVPFFSVMGNDDADAPIEFFHAIDNQIKTLFARVFLIRGPATSSEVKEALSGSFSSKVLGPIVEEVADRGFCQYFAYRYVYYHNLVRSYMFWGLGSKLTMALEALSFTSIVYGKVWKFAKKKPAFGGEPLLHLAEIINAIILLMPLFAMIRYLRADSIKESDAESITGKAQTDRPPVDGIRRNMIQKLERARRALGKEVPWKGGDRTLHYEWQDSVDKTAKAYGRWISAWTFGAAHGSGGPLGLQKIFGCTVSALLVETRLVMNRRTLWVAIGAHIFFNTQVSFSSLSRLKDEAIFFNPGAWYRALVLYPAFWTSTRVIASFIGKLESWVANEKGDFSTDS